MLELGVVVLGPRVEVELEPLGVAVKEVALGFVAELGDDAVGGEPEPHPASSSAAVAAPAT